MRAHLVNCVGLFLSSPCFFRSFRASYDLSTVSTTLVTAVTAIANRGREYNL